MLAAVRLPADRAATRSTLALAVLVASFAAGAFGLPQRWAVGALVLSGLVWLALCAALRRADVPRALAWGGFAALRALAWAAAPPTSPDVQRYAWEAEVWLAGFNPYLLAPDSAALEPLAREFATLHSAVEHRSIPAIYPPLAQASFVIAALAARAAALTGLVGLELARLIALRLLALLGDFAVAVLLERWLARRELARGAWLAWAWCPLVALEFAGAAHFDALGIALALAALSPMLAHAPRCAALLLAGAVAVKLLPICFVAWLPRARSGRRPLLVFALATALLLAPLAWSIRAAPGRSALATYAGWWESTSAIYTPLRALIGAVWGEGAWGLEPQHIARRLCVVLAAALLVWIAARRPAPERGALSASAAVIVLSPTFHPWYAAWVAVWLPLALASAPSARPSRRILWAHRPKRRRAPRDSAAPRSWWGRCYLLRPARSAEVQAGSRSERDASLALAMAVLAALAPAQYVMLERWREAGEWTAPVWLWPLMFAAPLGLLVRAGLARTR